MKLSIKIIAVSALIGGLVGSGVTFALLRFQGPTANDLIKEFYLTENAVLVSPHSLRKMMDKGETNYVLVDLRSSQEYEKEHIVGAVNIPAYKDPDTSAYEEKDRIVAEFKKLGASGRDIIVYCYSTPCMTGRKVGKILVDKGIFVKHLGIGWNEWRYFWTLWNHEHEWETTNPGDYLVSGKEPGVPKKRDLPSPCAEGDLGC